MHQSPKTARIAFLGTGLMGAPMAVRLSQAGHVVTSWNRSKERTRDLAAAGVAVAETAAQAVENSEFACLCLTDADAVRDVLFSPHGAVSGIKARSAPLVIDFTTDAPDKTRANAQRYRQATGGAWLDAPVSGGVERARSGSLIAFCGGDAGDFSRAEPLLGVLATRASLVGELGSGQAIKLVAQLIAAPTLIAISEALKTAEAVGLDSTQAIELLSGGLVDSPLLQIFGRRMASRQSEPRIGAPGTMRKDIDAALRMARASGTSVPLAIAAAEEYRAVCESGHALEELTALMSQESISPP